MKLFAIYLVVMNVLGVAVMWSDKRCARIIEHSTHDISLGFGFQIQAQSAKDQE